jgi:ABC-2 type transport system ATP-binding protein
VGPIALTATDTGDAWTVAPQPAGRPPTVEQVGTVGSGVRDHVAAPADVLYRLLWKRAPADDPALDNLRYFAELYGVAPREQRQRIGSLLELVGLTGREKERVEGFSRGMRQRLHIARGLLHDPEVLFLDEPTIGIDPVGARELRATIATLREQGKTILLTTHYMFEADELCDRIAVIRDGLIVAEGSPAVLKQRVSAGHVVEVETFGLPPSRTDSVRSVQGVRSVSVEERGQAQVLLVQVEPGAEVTSGVLAELLGTRVGRVSSREPTLEDAYVELVSGA